ncbi:hypothetical protein CEXT_520311 [Caerostris extrusa]|uniref:Uncharacterized protein n=1 Tax=Caerostris extrusa TaxID=172846 RepID=A0AAV4XJP9_CAEEX|nr:hypothetical protein CEXT_520311 [Caerostris extrusa]
MHLAYGAAIDVQWASSIGLTYAQLYVIRLGIPTIPPFDSFTRWLSKRSFSREYYDLRTNCTSILSFGYGRDCYNFDIGHHNTNLISYHLVQSKLKYASNLDLKRAMLRCNATGSVLQQLQ